MTPNSIKKETYVEANEKTRHALTYDMLMGLHDKFDQHLGVCDDRFCKLENHKRRNSTLSGFFGFLGGFVAMAVYWIKDRF